jgi:cytochrome b pre-mRNA-processing protein 3
VTHIAVACNSVLTACPRVAAPRRRDAELLARFTQRELECLQLTDDEHLLRGHVRFSGALKRLVDRAGGAWPPPAPEAAGGAAGARGEGGTGELGAGAPGIEPVGGPSGASA